jgi:nitrogen-specific signal transduction histidine kinase/CheY-like chemotaxis protein
MEDSSTRVLLVEDQLADALLVRRSLRGVNGSLERFDLLHAATLAQGLEHLRRDPVDVLLLDLGLPDSEGSSTVAKLRERDHCVPLVVFTGIDDPELAARAFEAGADEYLVKDDLHAGLLRRTIRHAIERRRASSRGVPAPALVREAPRDGHSLLHDLKNLQTCILGNARLLQREMRDDGFLRGRADALLGAARVASELIARLCAGGDPAAEPPGRLELSAFVRSVEPLLRAVLPDRVELRLDLARGLVPVAAQEEALRRALLELVVNAVEAIGDARGRIEVRTGLALLEADERSEIVAPRGIGRGPHAWLEVHDDGAGFDGATRLRLFEDGFSSKGAGRGQGLCQVKEILAEHAAGLVVRGRPGAGASFRVYLPAWGT